MVLGSSTAAAEILLLHYRQPPGHSGVVLVGQRTTFSAPRSGGLATPEGGTTPHRSRAAFVTLLRVRGEPNSHPAARV